MTHLDATPDPAIARHVGRFLGDVDMNPAVQAERERIAQHLEMLAKQPDAHKEFRLSPEFALLHLAKAVRGGDVA